MRVINYNVRYHTCYAGYIRFNYVQVDMDGGSMFEAPQVPGVSHIYMLQFCLLRSQNYSKATVPGFSNSKATTNMIMHAKNQVNRCSG